MILKPSGAQCRKLLLTCSSHTNGQLSRWGPCDDADPSAGLGWMQDS